MVTVDETLLISALPCRPTSQVVSCPVSLPVEEDRKLIWRWASSWRRLQVSKLSDLLLISRIRQRYWVSLSWLGYKWFPVSKLSPFVVLMEQVGQAYVARNWEWPLAICQLGNEALSISALKEVNPANNHTNGLRTGSFPSWASRWDCRPEANTPWLQHGLLTLRNCEIISVCESTKIWYNL